MNHLRKKKALELIKGKEAQKEDVADILLQAEFTNEEVAEVIEHISDPANLSGDKDPEPKKRKEPEKPKSPNDEIADELKQFDYKPASTQGQFRGDAFKKYVELVGDTSFVVVDEETGQALPVRGKLQLEKMYDFQLFKAKPVRKVRYVGVPESPVDYIGIEIVNDTPIHTTRISVQDALLYNAQIMNAHSIAGHGKYYLLKK